jgi:hypothetical protein
MITTADIVRIALVATLTACAVAFALWLAGVTERAVFTGIVGGVTAGVTASVAMVPARRSGNG